MKPDVGITKAKSKLQRGNVVVHYLFYMSILTAIFQAHA